jgi:Fur family ferric uptake transcriptional regulator
MVENSELRKAGLKVTLPRVKILQMLDSTEQRHMSAEDVYKALMEAGEDVGLATVYRVLTQFEAAGLVVRHNFDGGHAVFELADGGHHDHMVNVETGEVSNSSASKSKSCRRQLPKSTVSSWLITTWCCTCARKSKHVARISHSRNERRRPEGRLRAFCRCQTLAVTTIFFA